MPGLKARFFVRLIAPNGKTYDIDIDFRTLGTAKDMAKRALKEHPEKWTSFEVYEQ
jgi:hypothetical protein